MPTAWSPNPEALPAQVTTSSATATIGCRAGGARHLIPPEGCSPAARTVRRHGETDAHGAAQEPGEGARGSPQDRERPGQEEPGQGGQADRGPSQGVEEGEGQVATGLRDLPRWRT